MALPLSIPVITLAECNVFPHALLPLNIYEPRYREMLAEALRTDRFMAVASLRVADEDEAWDESEANIDGFSCAGLLRACVGQPDGSSRLILQGVGRIRFTGWLQRTPFRIARCEPVVSEIGDLKVADVVGYNFLSRASDRQPLLGMSRVEDRLEYILNRLGVAFPAAE
jgi:Lon protease-like protein